MVLWVNRLIDGFLKYFNLVFAIIIAGMFANALIFPNMGVDASFYLRVTECIAGGAIPEHDLRILYPPLVFYMLLPLKLLVGKAIAYELFLGYMFIIQLINAFLIFKISGQYSGNRFIRIFAGLLYLFLSMKLEGEYLFLEPFINLWGLLALWVYLKGGKHSQVFLLLSGGLTFLAFLTKQYGLAYAGAIYVIILIDERSSFKVWFKKSAIFTAGIAIGLIFFIVLFRIGYGVYYDFFAGGRLNVYGEKDLLAMLWGLFRYIEIAPYLLLLLIPAILIKLLKLKPHLFAYITLLFLFSIQLYFQQYDHYYMLMLPALIMVGALLFETSSDKKKILVLAFLIFSLFINEFFVGPRSKSLIFSKQKSLNSEIRIAQEIQKVIPEESNVYLFSSVKLYYLCHLKPAIPKKYGFAWNHTTTLSNLNEILQAADYVIVDKGKLHNIYPLIDADVFINDVISDNNLHLFSKTDAFLLFKQKIIN